MNTDLAYPKESVTRAIIDIKRIGFSEEYIGQEFHEQEIFLDGRSFSSCKFFGCVLYVSLGYVNFVNNDLFQCKVNLIDSAEVIYKIIKMGENNGH